MRVVLKGLRRRLWYRFDSPRLKRKKKPPAGDCGRLEKKCEGLLRGRRDVVRLLDGGRITPAAAAAQCAESGQNGSEESKLDGGFGCIHRSKNEIEILKINKTNYFFGRGD
jgi:hypothetical protein